MQLQEFLPSPPLRRYVQLIWCLELTADEHFGPPERIAPDGIVELVLHYRAPVAIRYAGESFAAQPQSSLVSQTRRFVEFAPRGATGLISVRFHPWGAYHFLALPVSTFADRCIPAAELWGSKVAALEEQLALATGTRERVQRVEGFLLEQQAQYQKPDVEMLLRRLWHSAGNTRVADFCRASGVTERTLERRCAAALGMAPRSYQRLARFLKACALLREGGWRSLTEVAHHCGYFDQAHFASDFRELAGLTPRQFLAAPAFSFLEPG